MTTLITAYANLTRRPAPSVDSPQQVCPYPDVPCFKAGEPLHPVMSPPSEPSLLEIGGEFAGELIAGLYPPTALGQLGQELENSWNKGDLTKDGLMMAGVTALGVVASQKAHAIAGAGEKLAKWAGFAGKEEKALARAQQMGAHEAARRPDFESVESPPSPSRSHEAEGLKAQAGGNASLRNPADIPAQQAERLKDLGERISRTEQEIKAIADPIDAQMASIAKQRALKIESQNIPSQSSSEKELLGAEIEKLTEELKRLKSKKSQQTVDLRKHANILEDEIRRNSEGAFQMPNPKIRSELSYTTTPRFISLNAKPVQDLLQDYSPGLWSRSEKLDPLTNLAQHYERHFSEFADETLPKEWRLSAASSPEEYQQLARKFIENPPDGTEMRIKTNGEVEYYHPNYQIRASVSNIGNVKTFFRPPVSRNPSKDPYGDFLTVY